jgi:hypothetical protein
MREGGYTGSFSEALKKIEKDVDDYLGNPGKKAAKAAQIEAPIPFLQEDPVDAIRHAEAGRLAAKAIAEKTGNIPYISKGLGALGSTILGIGHEVSSPKRDMKTGELSSFKDILREAGEDIYNNTYGALKYATSNKSDEEQLREIKEAAFKNELPDGVVGHNMYFKKQWGGETPTYYQDPAKFAQAQQAYQDSAMLYNDYQRMLGDMEDLGYKEMSPSMIQERVTPDTYYPHQKVLDRDQSVQKFRGPDFLNSHNFISEKDGDFFKIGDLFHRRSNKTISDQLAHKHIKPIGNQFYNVEKKDYKGGDFHGDMGEGAFTSSLASIMDDKGDSRQIFNYKNVKPKTVPVLGAPPEESGQQNSMTVSPQTIRPQTPRTIQGTMYTEDVGTKPKRFESPTGIQFTQGQDVRRTIEPAMYVEQDPRRASQPSVYYEPRPGQSLASFKEGGEIGSQNPFGPISYETQTSEVESVDTPATTQKVDTLPEHLTPEVYAKMITEQEVTQEGNVPDYQTNVEQNRNNAKIAESQVQDQVKSKYFMGYKNKKFLNQTQDEVKEIQNTLLKGGFYENGTKKDVDGKFGPRTLKAYNRFIGNEIADEKKTDWIKFPEETKKIWCEKSKCAQYVTLAFESRDVNVKSKGVIGNAWEMNRNILDKKGESKYNIYDRYDFSNVKNAEDLKKMTKEIKAKDHVNADMFNVGDVVGLYVDGSKYHKEALETGKGTYNTHVGYVSEIRNINGKRVPIISHNIGTTKDGKEVGKLHHDRWDKLTTTWISSPKHNKEKFVYSENVQKFDNKNALDHIKTRFNLNKDQVEKVDEVMNFAKNDIPKIAQEVGSSAPVDWLVETSMAITGPETLFGLRKPKVKDSVSEDVVKTVLGRSKDASEKSLGLGKVKTAKMLPFMKEFLGVDKTTINDNRKGMAAVASKLIAYYDYFNDYRQKNPHIDMTEEDARNLSILAYNQGLKDMLKIGSREDFRDSDAELEAFRELYKGTVSDVSSTKYRFLPKMIGEALYKMKYGKGHKTYINKVNDYREIVSGRQRAKDKSLAMLMRGK